MIITWRITKEGYEETKRHLAAVFNEDDDNSRFSGLLLLI